MTQKLYLPDSLFPSDNDLEIPTLLTSPLPEFCEIPFLCYGEQRRSKDMRGKGILHFYTDDYRFSALYEHPENILRHNPAAIIEPNFSLFNETPIAFGLQAIYKKRWIARAVQQRRIPVLVDLNVSRKFARFNLIGVPKGYPAYATRAYSNSISELDYEYALACEHAEGLLSLFVVYGGGHKAAEWCHRHPFTCHIDAGKND